MKKSSTPINADQPVRFNTEVEKNLLSHPEFSDVPTEELIRRAELHLERLRANSQGGKVTDRVMAIAVLLGFKAEKSH